MRSKIEEIKKENILEEKEKAEVKGGLWDYEENFNYEKGGRGDGEEDRGYRGIK